MPDSTLMAGSVVTGAITGPVTIPVGKLIASDEVTLSPSMNATVTAVLSKLGGRMRTLAVAVRLDSGVEYSEVTYPADVELVLLSATRVVDHPCRLCGRSARWVVDLAACTVPPETVICVDCDRKVLAEVRAEHAADKAKQNGRQPAWR